MWEDRPAFENSFGTPCGGMDMLPKPVAGKLPMLVTGGSQGARVFNDLVPAAVARLPEAQRQRLKLVQQVPGDELAGAVGHHLVRVHVGLGT